MNEVPKDNKRHWPPAGGFVVVCASHRSLQSSSHRYRSQGRPQASTMNPAVMESLAAIVRVSSSIGRSTAEQLSLVVVHPEASRMFIITATAAIHRRMNVGSQTKILGMSRGCRQVWLDPSPSLRFGYILDETTKKKKGAPRASCHVPSLESVSDQSINYLVCSDPSSSWAWTLQHIGEQ